MTALQSITARPIHYTSRSQEAIAPFETLGLVRVEGGAGEAWQLFDCPGGGGVGIHAVAAGDPLDGTTVLGFEADDLDGVLAELRAHSPALDAAIVEAAHGRALQIRAGDGTSFFVDVRAKRSQTAPAPEGIAVSQMWFTPDVPGAYRILTALGGTPITTSGKASDGAPSGWADLRLPAGGRAQAHQAEHPRVSAGWVVGPGLDELRDRLVAAGFPAAIVDESYGRYLELTPHGYDAELAWVNEEQFDSYGYIRHS